MGLTYNLSLEKQSNNWLGVFVDNGTLGPWGELYDRYKSIALDKKPGWVFEVSREEYETLQEWRRDFKSLP